MPDPPPRTETSIEDAPLSAEMDLALDGDRLARIEQRQPAECSELEIATMAYGYVYLAQRLEKEFLSRSFLEIVAEGQPEVRVGEDAANDSFKGR